MTFPVNLTGLPGIIAAIGAAGLGPATAAATAHRWICIATSLILVPGYALVVAAGTIGYLTVACITALIWWHLTATARTVRDGTPDDHALVQQT